MSFFSWSAIGSSTIRCFSSASNMDILAFFALLVFLAFARMRILYLIIPIGRTSHYLLL